MSQRVPIPIARRQGEAKSSFVSSQRLCNAFLEQDPETGEFAVYKGPGLLLFSNISTSTVRGLHDFNGTLLAVVGTTLYTVTSAGTATSQGTIAGTAAVIIADNGSQAAIVADSVSYSWNGTALSTISDADFLTATSVDFLDQYLLFSKASSGNFFLSALSDATAYDALDIATAESNPDNLVRVIVDNREALLFGTKSMESWYNAGDADFPFVRGQTYVELGLIGKYAIAKIDNSVAWLAPDKTVRIIRAGSPQIISDAFASAEIERWSDASVTKAFSFSMRGHQFLVLRNPDGCLIWDASMPAGLAWSTRESYDSDTWRVWVGVHMVDWDKTIVGDADTGILYELDQDTYSENGDPLVWQLTSRTMGPGGQPFTLDAVEIEIEPGVSLVSGQGSDATVWLEASRDSGVTFGSRLERSLGAIGVRNKRIVWRNLGQFPPHGGVIRLSGSDPVSNVITKGWADIEADAL